MFRHGYARGCVQGPRFKACVVSSLLPTITSQGSQCIRSMVIGRSWLDTDTRVPILKGGSSRFMSCRSFYCHCSEVTTQMLFIYRSLVIRHGYARARAQELRRKACMV